MNLFSGGTVADGVFHLGDIAVPLPEAIKAQVRAGQGLTLGVHPEAACLIGSDRPRPDGILLPGTAEIVEPDFAHRTQTVYARAGELSYAASGALDISLDVGDEVEVVFPFDELYFFDGETERRL